MPRPPIRFAAAAALAVAALCSASARADDPKYDFGKQEQPKAKVEWKASAQIGLMATTGNSQSVNLSGGISASRNDGKNKVALDVTGAFGRSEVLTVVTAPNPVAGMQLDFQPKITAANALAKLRYDRFFTTNNSGYVSAFVGLDYPAGKDLLGGGQIGYARQIVHTPKNLLSGEVGYDISFVDFVTPEGSHTLLHSARLFLGYVLTINDSTALTASVEALINGNPVDIAGNHYGFADASRVIGKASITTRLWKNLSFRFSFTARFDNAPAAVPLPSGFTPPPGFQLLADRLDTLSEASLVITFL
jgi:hypothetical protein